MQYAKTQKYTHAVFANSDVNIPLFNIPRNRLQNITESTNIRIKVQLSQPFSRRHNSLFYRAINHHQLAYFLPSPRFVQPPNLTTHFNNPTAPYTTPIVQRSAH